MNGMDTARIADTATVLRAVRPFHLLDESELLLIARHARQRRFDPGAVLLAAGSVAEFLFVGCEGDALTPLGPAVPVFDAPSVLFGLPVRADHHAGPQGFTALCLAKPHLFTIARECPDFIVGLAALEREGRA
jgi:hypothetical protein